MTTEDRLRRAIADHTSHVEPRSEGLADIEERLMETQRDDRRNKVLLGVAAAVAAVALIVGAIALLGDDDDDVVTEPGPSSTTTTEAPTTTTEAPTTTTTAAPPVQVSAGQVVWPRPATSQRFDDPVAAALSFAVDFAGFTDPVVGEFQQGDSRSGEVSVRPGDPETLPETTVLVRQMADDTWWVIGSITEDITVDSPQAGDTSTCPEDQAVSGTALAFEGHVDVRIVGYSIDGSERSLGEGFVTGSGSPPAGPFSGDIPCDLPDGTDGFGVMVFSTVGGEDSSVWQIVSFPIAFAG